MASKPIPMTPEEARNAILSGSCPENAAVDGELMLSVAPHLKALPKGLRVRGSLTLMKCHGLRRLPEGLAADDICVLSCAAFEGFHDACTDFGLPGGLAFIDCPSLTRFPARLEAGGDLVLRHCPEAWSWPDGPGRRPGRLRVGGYAHIEHCAGLSGLPTDTQVDGELAVRDCDRLRSLPAGLAAGSLTLKRCAALAQLLPIGGRSLRLPGDLSLEACPALTGFPGEVSVGGAFRMANCPRAWAEGPGLAGAPDSLVVGGTAEIVGCAGLSGLPRRMAIGKSLDILECHGLRHLGWEEEQACERTAGEACRIVGCDGLRSVDGLSFRGRGRVEIHRCPVLETLGSGVRPQFQIAVVDCLRFATAPEGVALSGQMFVHGCPSFRQSPRVTGGGMLTLSGSTPGAAQAGAAEGAKPAPSP